MKVFTKEMIDQILIPLVGCSQTCPATLKFLWNFLKVYYLSYLRGGVRFKIEYKSKVSFILCIKTQVLSSKWSWLIRLQSSLIINPCRSVHFWKLYWNKSEVKFLFSHCGASKVFLSSSGIGSRRVNISLRNLWMFPIFFTHRHYLKKG